MGVLDLDPGARERRPWNAANAVVGTAHLVPQLRRLLPKQLRMGNGSYGALDPRNLRFKTGPLLAYSAPLFPPRHPT